jgi:hypothetical protein
MIKRGAVRGLIVVTTSEHDTAVGTFYSLAHGCRARWTLLRVEYGRRVRHQGRTVVAAAAAANRQYDFGPARSTTLPAASSLRRWTALPRTRTSMAKSRMPSGKPRI